MNLKNYGGIEKEPDHMLVQQNCGCMCECGDFFDETTAQNHSMIWNMFPCKTMFVLSP